MLVLPGAVLQIEHRVALRAILIFRSHVNKRVECGVRDLRKIMDSAQLAMWSILQEILIVGRKLDRAAPAAGTVEALRARVCADTPLRVDRDTVCPAGSVRKV